QSIDFAKRKLVLKRSDGSTATYKASTNMVNFGQLKVGDEVLATVTENFAFFVIKGGGTKPGVAGMVAFARPPKGANPGGMFLETININAKVLDVDRDWRRVLLQYDTNDTRSVKVGPNVDLTDIAPSDTVLVRGTEAL